MKPRPPDDGSTPRTSRRRLLHLGAVLAGVGLAGCTEGPGSPTDSPATSPTPTDSATPSSSPSPSPTPVPLTEPVSVPEDSRCAVCNMYPAKFPDYNAQLSVAGGERVHFCSTGCLFAYAVAPDHFDAGHARGDVVGQWVHDHATTDLIDATAATFVLELDAERVEDPMRRNPLAFADEADAMAYVEGYDDLTSHDVVGYGAFDLALARSYRARLLPETDRAAIIDPVAVPEGASCGVCGMMPAKFPRWNAQLSTEAGERTFFCSPGCLAAYHAVPGHFDPETTTADIVGVWAHDFETGEQLDATLASFVLETDPDRVDDPMMVNPLPFADPAGAQAYVDQYDDLTAEDVIGLLEFDRNLAETYRSKFL